MLISKKDFTDYEALINESKKDFLTKKIIWLKSNQKLSRYQDSENNNHTPIELNVLCNYNYMRSWPITTFSNSGALDKQSVQVLLNKAELKSLGHLTDQGYWAFSPNEDYLIMDGLRYIFVGDTAASQSLTDDLFITVIIKREETETGDKHFG